MQRRTLSRTRRLPLSPAVTFRWAACLGLLAAMLWSSIAAQAATEAARPVAIRRWGDGIVSIETFWNLKLAITPGFPERDTPSPLDEGDLVIVTGDAAANKGTRRIESTHVISATEEDGRPRRQSLILDRPPNTPEPWVKPKDAVDDHSRHAVRVTIGSTETSGRGQADAPSAPWILLRVANVKMLYLTEPAVLASQDRDALSAARGADALVFPYEKQSRREAQRLAEQVRRFNPRLLVPIDRDPGKPDPFMKAMRSDFTVERAPGNTVALGAERGPSVENPRLTELEKNPWSMSDAMARLFRKKDRAAERAASVFEQLSVGQLNHRPADGSHTPRWNVEHLMGRELLFFSRLYSRLDRSIAPIDLNPAQTPDDYDAAHPQWSGAEEARQIRRVTAFTRRFAYLLDPVGLDGKPGDARRSSRGLLELLANHYDHHLDAVKKKFELSDWPGSVPTQ